MTIQDLGSIGELIAAIATIVTLVYLALQLRANTKATQASNWHEITRDYVRFNERLLDSKAGQIWRQGIKQYPNLAVDENEIFKSLMANQALQFQAIFAQYQSRLLEHETYIAYLKYFCSLVAQDGGRYWWESAARPIFVGSMVRAVDAHLETGDYPGLPEEMEAAADSLPNDL